MARYKLGEYDIIKELGRGRIGVVYLAEHQRLKKKYAVKILPKKFAQESELVQRFHTEAQVTAELNHPNIVKVVNMSCEGTTYYLVMDYVESETGSPKIRCQDQSRSGTAECLKSSQSAIYSS
ncbi:MAG: protein kinase [Candidatus Aminicenantes bacterium]|nr:protein kinase [Candidatus Aminicenantes bacterium]